MDESTIARPGLTARWTGPAPVSLALLQVTLIVRDLARAEADFAERLGLRVDPVQVLEDQQEGLHLALPQEQTLEGVQGALAALRRIKGLP